MDSERINITSFEEFESVISNLTKSLNTIREALDYEKKSAKRFEDKEIWDGKAGESISNKVKEYQECFSPIVESFDTYIKFLQETLDNYKNAEDTFKKSIENNAEDLNVN